ncbi:MAG: TolC family outer membrane protein [Gammaproteobacteria bacterium]|nr:TolC family outer membrane protein [Gammaproteobacteria bacterium]MDH3563050.1 TolC family outer membrane protein [Gammaproteobacteria bacterium]MDH5488144.1 TolC family outer membrane protein [Gammaproteobacteria bacterium]
MPPAARLILWWPALLAGLLLAPLPLAAEDLVAVYNLAHANDPKFRAAESNYLAGREKLPQARATLLPTINARAARDRNDTETATDAFIPGRPSGRFEFSSADYSLNVSQPVYNGVVFAGLKQARAEVRRAEAEYAAAGQELVLRVAEAYFGVLAAQDNLEFTNAEQAAIHRQLQTADARLQVGLATITDVHDARARYEIAGAEVISAQNNLQDKREALREVTGRAFEVLARLGEFPPINPEPAQIRPWVEKALSENHALRARREGVESAREEVKRLQAGHYPTLDIVGSRSRSDSDGSITGTGIRSDNTVVGLELNVPIFQGGLVSARTQEAAHRFDAAQHELEAVRRATERTARAAYHGVESGAAKVTALTQAVVASESALSAKTEGFAAGIGTSLDVLDANRDLFRAKRDLASARYDYLLNGLRLKLAAGTLSETDLEQINGWLQ